MRSKGGHHNGEKLSNKQGGMWLRASVSGHIDEISEKKKIYLQKQNGGIVDGELWWMPSPQEENQQIHFQGKKETGYW